MKGVLAVLAIILISGCAQQTVTVSENKAEIVADGVISNNMPRSALLDYPHIYFYDTQEGKYTIKKINVLDGNQSLLNDELEKDENPSELLAENDKLYLYRPDRKKIYSIDKSGGDLEPASEDMSLVADLSQDSSYFYFTYVEPGNLYKSLARMKKGGKATEILAQNIGNMFTSVSVSDAVYFTNETGLFKITDDNNIALIERGNYYLNGGDDGNLYLNEFSKGRITLVRISKNGGKNTVSQCQGCSFVGADESFAYLKDATGIKKMDKNGNIIVLAQGDFRWIGMDTDYIYYNDFDTIYRVLKS